MLPVLSYGYTRSFTVADYPGAHVLFHNWWIGPKTWGTVQEIDPVGSHASWMENFPWTRLPGVELPAEAKKAPPETGLDPLRVREVVGNGSYGGLYQRGALLFHWPQRQVRVEGPVERVTEAESDAYWATRPPASRRSAAASRQSEPIGSREELEARVAAPSPEPPRPASWGGFRLVSETIEFWEHRNDRLHDRHRWTRGPGGWEVERLQP